MSGGKDLYVKRRSGSIRPNGEEKSSPWTDGPRELIQHAVDHLAEGSDFDRRIAMVSVDNAVELTVKTWLGLPHRTKENKGPGRRELEDAGESFPALMDLLQEYGSDKITGLSLDDVEWYHRLRNQLYHSGNGITVEKSKVETYLELAMALFQNLFEETLSLLDTVAIRTNTGEFLELWNQFERLLRPKLPPKGDSYAYNWKRDYLRQRAPGAVDLYNTIGLFRMQLVHGPDEPNPEDIDAHIVLLRKLARDVGIELGQGLTKGSKKSPKMDKMIKKEVVQ